MDERVASGSPYEATVGFSRAVRTDRQVYVSGTAPIWPGGHVDPEPLAQARRCWEIALDALTRLGGSSADVVRTRTFITDRKHEQAASQAHGEVFADVRPASTMLVVAGLLDERWVVEVELDAVLPDV
jgi:enamine deaminase RidA (YjgF/YER057c/UK114 family)